MGSSQAYFLIAIIVLFVIAILLIFFKKNKKETTFTPLASISFGFVIAGIVFGENRLLGYSLIAIGVLFAMVDIIKKLKKKKR